MNFARKPLTITEGDSFKAIDFPESRLGPWRTVRYGCQDFRVYHDSDPRQAVWGDYSMERCEEFMRRWESSTPAEAVAQERAEFARRSK